MESYFVQVVESLNIDDTVLLGVLSENDATTKIKAIKNQTLFEKSNLTEAKYRKAMDRLVALKFIVPVKDHKEHLLYVSDFGENALQYIIQSIGRVVGQ